MPTMNISLTDHLKKVVEKRIAEGSYSSASEYVRDLIRADEMKSRTDAMKILDPVYYNLLTDEERKKAKEELAFLLREDFDGKAVEAD